ncbi:Dynein heavy chain 10, axonemal [Myotis davidii]|uniref:Dynein heavy chain 10, axonemal n=1 Tax=Myotis davidii TaxID=225400 RepID=L5LKH9_MYODS|nr:Dynein heavy chain 10, axonemal [Myotis davidii]
MKFSVVKYFKGTQERGYILGSVDEIIQCLDDNTFNLQSISGSRFVGPFLQTVHKWEKTLSLIGEVIEMYDNIAALRFQDGDSGEKLVSAMISAEGEVMEFRKTVRAEGRVEDWMTAVLNEMRRTNRLITKEAIFRYCEDRSR